MTDEDALEAINFRKIPGRGEMISVRPYTLCCSFSVGDHQAIDLVIGDLKYLAIEKKLRVDMIVESDIAKKGGMIESIKNDEELEPLIGDIVAVGETEIELDYVSKAQSFDSAIDGFLYFKDHKLAEGIIMIVCGSQEFITKNIEILEEAVRDDFAY